MITILSLSGCIRIAGGVDAIYMLMEVTQVPRHWHKRLQGRLQQERPQFGEARLSRLHKGTRGVIQDWRLIAQMPRC